MADVFDIIFHITNDVNNAVQPIVGTPYQLPANTLDATLYGPTRDIPPIELVPGNILLEEIMNRLELGEAQIQVESETYDVPCPQVLVGSLDDTDPPTIPQPMLLTTVVGNVCTLSGGIQAGDVIGINVGLAGTGYAVQAADTLSTVAANIAAASTAAGLPATASGLAITVTGNQAATFTVGTTWNRIRESSRRRKVFFATLYTATPYDRSAIGKVLETVYPPGSVLSLPDGSAAKLVPINQLPMQSFDDDSQQRDTTWSRRVRWVFEFVSTITIPVVTIVAINGRISGSVAFTTTQADIGLDHTGGMDTFGWLDYPLAPPLPSQL